MRFSTAAMAASAAAGAAAQRPNDTSICDYYTTALLKENNAKNQHTLLTLVVNTAVIGNYTEPNVGISVPGILAKGQYKGEDVNLMPYFDGTLASTNRGGDMGVSVNFLDGGGAAPLKENMAANSKDSQQYFLLTHLYQYFGALLGCSKYGMGAFPSYEGHTSMYDVHKFMDLSEAEFGYFVSQVGMSAASFGVADSDVKAVGTSLMNAFGYRCSPPMSILPDEDKELQAICIDESCPKSEMATCDAYDKAMEPMTATATADMTSMMTEECDKSTMMPTMTSNQKIDSETMMPTMSSMHMTGSESMMPTMSSMDMGASTMMPSGSMAATSTMMPTAGAASVGMSVAGVAGAIAAFFI